MELPVKCLASLLLLVVLGSLSEQTLAIRFPDPIRESTSRQSTRSLKIAVFALGSFWRSEAAFGCLPGVVRTAVGYAGGSKSNPEYRNLGDHAECVQIEYDPNLIQFKQLLDVFWASHDSRQVFGQGPDVGNQYRSIIFTNGTVEARLAAASKEREQTKSRSSIVTTQIQQLGTFCPAESDHQKFELKRNRFLLQLLGNMPEEELVSSNLAAKVNGYAAELCPPAIQKRIDAKIDDILKRGWPFLREGMEASNKSVRPKHGSARRYVEAESAAVSPGPSQRGLPSADAFLGVALTAATISDGSIRSLASISPCLTSTPPSTNNLHRRGHLKPSCPSTSLSLHNTGRHGLDLAGAS